MKAGLSAVVGVLLCNCWFLNAMAQQVNSARDVENQLPALRAAAVTEQQSGVAALKRLGTPAMPAIAAAIKAEKQEQAKAHLRDVYETLEERAALTGDYVSVDVKDADVDAVLSDAIAQSRLPIKVVGQAQPRTPKVTLKLSDVPLLKVLEEVNRQSHILVMLSDRRVIVGDSSRSAMWVDPAGVMMLGGMDFWRKSHTPVQIKDTETFADHYCRFAVTFTMPRSQFIYRVLEMPATRDDRGNVVIADMPVKDFSSWSSRQHRPEGSMFELPVKNFAVGRKIPKLVGTYRYAVALRHEKVAIDLGKPGRYEVEGHVLAYHRCEEKDDQLSVWVDVSKAGLSPEERKRLEFAFYSPFGAEARRLVLKDRQGQQVAELGDMGGDKGRLRLVKLGALPKNAVDYVLELEVPTRIKEYRLDFEAENIPGPL